MWESMPIPDCQSSLSFGSSLSWLPKARQGPRTHSEASSHTCCLWLVLCFMLQIPVDGATCLLFMEVPTTPLCLQSGQSALRSPAEHQRVGSWDFGVGNSPTKIFVYKAKMLEVVLIF